MTTNPVGRRLTAAAMVALMALPQALWAEGAIDEDPSAGAMIGDLLVARPLGLVATVGGTAAFLVSLPFTLLAGHTAEAADTLVVGPAQATFVRCLGCREVGYTHKDIDLYRKQQREAAAAEEAKATAEANAAKED